MIDYRDRYYRELHRHVEKWEESFREFIRNACRSGFIKTLLLVGSRARGDYRDSSDFDVIAVIGDDADAIEIIARLRRLIKDRFPLDLIAIPESDLGDPLYREMLKDSIDLCREERDIDTM